MTYRLVRSKRKTLALEITREGDIVARAPLRMSQSAIDKFVKEHEEWISKHLERQKVRRASHPEPDDLEVARLKAMAKELIPKRVEYFGNLMNLFPNGVKITSAKTRFGSCSPTNSLSFSWRLMQYPMEAVDYVVVHELAHIVHKNHQKAFYDLISTVMPDYRERVKLLRE